jgi:hypothetical protein
MRPHNISQSLLLLLDFVFLGREKLVWSFALVLEFVRTVLSGWVVGNIKQDNKLLKYFWLLHAERFCWNQSRQLFHSVQLFLLF